MTNVYDRIKGLPKASVSCRGIEEREGTAYVTIDGHRSSDFNVYVL
jgi:hypothetical protein